MTDEGTNKKLIRTAKNRLVWTPVLRDKFTCALNKLREKDKATPKRILKEMNVPGLTREHVSSRLQKYNLQQKKTPNVWLENKTEGSEEKRKSFSAEEPAPKRRREEPPSHDWQLQAAQSLPAQATPQQLIATTPQRITTFGYTDNVYGAPFPWLSQHYGHSAPTVPSHFPSAPGTLIIPSWPSATPEPIFMSAPRSLVHHDTFAEAFTPNRKTSNVLPPLHSLPEISNLLPSMREGRQGTTLPPLHSSLPPLRGLLPALHMQ
ncbi:hypothetical protein PROFUN_04794 [Planoprotostelium fungivorum]|uniref:HTH myb-type domain-containing protein n=1 Tax=Planoprotostelium fungivorum TaxID=1890364 RepID=A0A2P6NT54_9EUKA|nr:hypothetical protein PROFUN_04794 [Planoprotostelium fungivorum]